MKKIIWNEAELKAIKTYGEICLAMAREAMERNKLSFDDIEEINEHYENHKWGSNADRAYRKRAVNKAVLKVADSPAKYSV